jgi:hypothetical protein
MHGVTMIRGTGFVAGLLAFAGAHAIETLMWSTWFESASSPWFLNSGRAAAFTLVCLLSVSLAAGWFRVPGVTIAAGAATGMVAVLFFKRGGAGTIFPIVLIVGGLVVAGATLLGAWLGWEARRFFVPER